MRALKEEKQGNRSSVQSIACNVGMGIMWHVSRLGLVVRRSAGQRKDTGSTLRFGSLLLSRDFAMHKY